jgi:hypothetical protein
MEKKQGTNWQAAGIGAFVGFVAISLAVIWWAFEGEGNWLLASIILLPVFLGLMIGAVVGAVIGIWKKSQAALRTGSILGLILGLVIEIITVYGFLLSIDFDFNG